jgi:hypothetical protein
MLNKGNQVPILYCVCENFCDSLWFPVPLRPVTKLQFRKSFILKFISQSFNAVFKYVPYHIYCLQEPDIEEATMWTRKDINDFKELIRKEESDAIIKVGTVPVFILSKMFLTM